MSDACSLYVTAPSRAVAEEIARRLVEERLAACVNVLPEGLSFYRWDGAVQRDAEVVLFCKTSAALAQRATARVVELHPYEVPCVVRLSVEGGHGPYLDWLAGALEPPAADAPD